MSKLITRLEERVGARLLTRTTRALSLTAEGEAYYKDEAYAFRTIRPFLQKWGCISEDYDALYQQALDEMQQSTFRATWNIRSAWGINPQSPRWPRRD